MSSGNASMPLLGLGVVLVGLGTGNATSLPPLIAQAEFAKEEVGRVVALIVTASQAAYAFAPDTAVYVVAALVQLAAIIVYLAGRSRGAQPV